MFFLANPAKHDSHPSPRAPAPSGRSLLTAHFAKAEPPPEPVKREIAKEEAENENGKCLGWFYQEREVFSFFLEKSGTRDQLFFCFCFLF